jgi:hypothetical protein
MALLFLLVGMHSSTPSKQIYATSSYNTTIEHRLISQENKSSNNL